MQLRRQFKPAPLPLFDGLDYKPEFDLERLTGQTKKVYTLMQDGQWRTLTEIKMAIGGGSETGISATLRNFRKPQHGQHVVNKRRRGNPKDGLYEYSLIIGMVL